MKNIGIFFFLLFTTACHQAGHDLEYYIFPVEREITVDSEGIRKYIRVTANCEWEVLDVPNWCIIKKQVENNKTYLDIKVLPNEMKDARNATILLVFKNISESVIITQNGMNDVNTSLQWHTFPMNFFTDIKYEIQNDNITRSYQITGEELFVNRKIREQIFPGNIINNHIDNILSLNDYCEKYTYNPITITSNDGKIQGYFTPSFNAFDKFLHDLPTPKQNIKITISSPIRYTSYRHLHLLGIGNLGLALDEIIAGESYTESEMKHRTGILYIFSRDCYSLIMDYPQSLIKETISDSELSNLSYISSVTLGQTALLLIESDYDFATIENIITKIIKDEELNDNDISIKDDFIVWLISFERGGERLTTGDCTLIREYIEKLLTIDSEEIIPLHFSINKLKDHSRGSFKITFNLQ